jgi:Flp pilus assembly protein CpaB
VLVLAVDTIAVRPEDKMAVQQLNAALLAVKPAESQRLTLAQGLSNGDIKLVLRAHDDDTKVPLPPLERLEHDTGASGDAELDPTTQITYKLAVAKGDLEAGTEIDDPEKFFKVESFPVSPDKAVSGEELASLKGKKIQHALFKDGVLTTKHFAENELLKVSKAKKAEVNKHMMFIQNGGKSPEVVVFENGIATSGDPRPTIVDPPAEKTETPVVPEIPPVGGDQ